MAARIEDYALIGDCETAALVCRDGSIDWLCWPRFDSGACFASLLGTPENGRWRLAASDGAARVSRAYRPRTLILETFYETATGTAKVIDFMPPRGKASDIVRIVVGQSGEVAFHMDLVLRFDYGTIVPWVSRLDDGRLRAIAGPDMVVLDTPAPVHGENMHSVADFTVKAGEEVPFILTYVPGHLPHPPRIDWRAALRDTADFWREWTQTCTAAGEWTELVVRSLITLKALTYAPTGGIVAAPTTSLPEKIGGVRNWDYRYCWLRDATLTLLTLMNAGYFEEASAWRDWLARAVAGNPEQVRILYGIGGERRVLEWEAPWLAGYEASRPVRIGNAASEQVQLDVFGEVMDALHQARLGGLEIDGIGWEVEKALLAYLETIWREPDEGIWEVRSGRHHFVYSKVMAWVAFDRAVQSAEIFGLDGPVERWRALRREIHAQVCDKGFDRSLNSFTQSYGSADLDASLLLLASVGFVEADDPRYLGTVAAIERALIRDGLVMRYDSHEVADGLPAGEGAFLACSFWLADAYALIGRRDDALKLFERLILLVNDVGLLAEEYDVADKRQVGNFPQAFSHIALVDTAHILSRVTRPDARGKGARDKAVSGKARAGRGEKDGAPMGEKAEPGRVAGA